MLWSVEVASQWSIGPGAPVAGRHYPRSLLEFEAWFPNEVAARRYLTELRWPDGFVCPHCGSDESRRHRQRWWCQGCHRWVSLTSGTLFDHTRVPLRTWLAAAWYVTNEKTGVAAMSLERALGIASTTAWHLLHKLRVPMDQLDREPLTGEIEVDETYVGGREPGLRGGRAKGKKVLVAVACECGPKTSIRRIRLAQIPDVTATTLARFITANIAAGSVLLTDDYPAYRAATKHTTYVHKPVSLRATRQVAHIPLPRVHKVASLLKRWLLGTHQGSVDPHHLDAYLDEFVFRFNRRTSTSRGLLFYRLLTAALATNPVRRDEITGGRP